MLKLIQLFKKPSAIELAKAGLVESERQAMQHGAAASYHDHMASYHQKNVDTLKDYLNQSGE